MATPMAAEKTHHEILCAAARKIYTHVLKRGDKESKAQEHVRRWSGLNPEAVSETIALPDLVALMGTESRRHWLDDDYVSRWLPNRPRERLAVLQRLGRSASGSRHAERA